MFIQRSFQSFFRFLALCVWLVVGASSLMACSKTESEPRLPSGTSAAAAQVIEVWKTPTCGCCGAWVDHLKENGFQVKVNDVSDTAAFRAALGMPQQYGSCHSASIQGYAIEGHVPAADIQKLIAEKPDAVGLSVPGMPLGSPGMEHPDHTTKRHEYDVLLVDKRGGARAYTHYTSQD